MKKYVLYVYFEALSAYFEAHVVKCDMCGEMFQVKKGFVLAEDTIACYKHLSKEFLEKFNDTH